MGGDGPTAVTPLTPPVWHTLSLSFICTDELTTEIAQSGARLSTPDLQAGIQDPATRVVRIQVGIQEYR